MFDVIKFRAMLETMQETGEVLEALGAFLDWANANVSGERHACGRVDPASAALADALLEAYADYAVATRRLPTGE